MYTINRGVAVIKPRQPYLDWIRNLPDPDDEITLDALRDECTAILVPEDSNNLVVMEFINANHEWIFEVELESWWTDDADWPAKRDWETFCKWFDVEYHSVVIDPSDEAICKEDY